MLVEALIAEAGREWKDIPGDVMGGSELTGKILGYAERNVANSPFPQG